MFSAITQTVPPGNLGSSFPNIWLSFRDYGEHVEPLSRKILVKYLRETSAATAIHVPAFKIMEIDYLFSSAIAQAFIAGKGMPPAVFSRICFLQDGEHTKTLSDDVVMVDLVNLHYLSLSGCCDFFLFAASLSRFPALKEGISQEGIIIFSPVLRLIPFLAFRCFLENVPKPGRTTDSPFPMASIIVSIVAFTAL